MKIDLHTHILPPPDRWPDWTQRSGYPGWITLERQGTGCARMCRTEAGGGRKFFREIGANCWDSGVRRGEMAASGVSVQVLSSVPVLFSYWARACDALDFSRFLNDHIAEVCRGEPTHFVGLGTIPMQEPGLAIRELERCVRELGMPGVQIGTNVNGKNLDDAGVFEVLAAAERLGACVFVHPWEMLGAERTARYWLGWLAGMPAETCVAMCTAIFSGLLDRLPRLRLCFAHGGGSFPGTLGRIAHGHECRPDLVAMDNPRGPREYLAGAGRTARFYVDSLVHDASALRLILETFGADRVALGSDYPFPLGEDRPGSLIESLRGTIADRDVARLLHGSAEEFLARPGLATMPR